MPKLAAPLPDAAAPAPDRAEAERAGRMLDRLADMAMEQAEVTHQAVLAAARAGDAAMAKDFGLAFDRAARGVRRTLALKAHLARQRQEAADQAEASAKARSDAKSERRRQVARAITHGFASDFPVGENLGKRLSHDVWTRLIDDPEIDAVLALAGQPIEEIVIRLCRDMGLEPEAILLQALDAADAGPAPPPRPPPAKAGPPPEPPLPRPWWPYCRLIPTEDGKQVGEPYWWNSETQQRVEGPMLDELNARAAAAAGV